jgi:hypothetical protein
VPEDGFASGWLNSGPTLRFSESNLFDYIDGGAELFLEFGFRELLVQHYERDSSEITLELYRMESPEAALGIYLTKSDEETPVSGIAARNSGSPYQLTALRGNSFIQINNFEGAREFLPVMAALAARSLSRIPEGKPVRLFDSLPKENLVPGSEMLVRGQFGLQPIFTFGNGDVLQLRGKVFAVVGDYYEVGGEGRTEEKKVGPHDLQAPAVTDTISSAAGTYTRIVVLYPDRGSARRAYSNLVKNLDPYLQVLRNSAGGTGGYSFIFKDYQDKFGSVELRGRNLDIRVNLANEPR